MAAGSVRRSGGQLRRGGEEAGERELQLAGARVATGGVAGQRALDDADEGRGQIGALVAQPLGAVLLVAQPDFGERAGRQREAAGDEAEQQDADAVDVGLRRRRAAREQLGRHVERRAGEIRDRGLVGQLADAAGAEVHQHHAAAAIAHHVLRLDVAMQQAGRVHRGQRFAHLGPEQRRLAGAEPALLLDDLLERRALDQLHPEAGEAGGAGRAEHRDDAAVPDLGQQAAFVDDDHRLVALRGFGDELERDLAIELRIPGAIDDAVGAAADDLAQREMGPDVAGVELGRAARPPTAAWCGAARRSPRRPSARRGRADRTATRATRRPPSRRHRRRKRPRPAG